MWPISGHSAECLQIATFFRPWVRRWVRVTLAGLLRQPGGFEASPYVFDATRSGAPPRADGPPRRRRQSLGSAGGLQQKLDVLDRLGVVYRGTTQRAFRLPVASCAREATNCPSQLGGDGVDRQPPGWRSDQGPERTSREQCDKELSHRSLLRAQPGARLPAEATPRLVQRLTHTSTFSLDIAYSYSPAASRACRRSVKTVHATTLPPLSSHTWKKRLEISPNLCLDPATFSGSREEAPAGTIDQLLDRAVADSSNVCR